MVASDSFAEFLRERLASLGRVTPRCMFGTTGVFCDGVMFGTVTEKCSTSGPTTATGKH
ncbi:MAG: hypothetical protein EPO55_00320 [Reyranella sp.]|uniref:TfoX/Sxy family protein n=1 Tax=Reyranella sp. TaxID=1929291 RepID=UPI0012099859|nr:TfoX/Sxy family protein [Reyranella sp.]TAJ42951.1 MAG: hypothetical protein EPO55_00320 [Reyranella sp.]